MMFSTEKVETALLFVDCSDLEENGMKLGIFRLRGVKVLKVSVTLESDHQKR